MVAEMSFGRSVIASDDGGASARRALRVLVVCRSDPSSAAQSQAKAPFINEQVAALRKAGVDVSFSFVLSGGARGYLAGVTALRRRMRKERFDLVHAHYGLSGLVGRFQMAAPLIVTFHGSDVHRRMVGVIARMVAAAADWRIFVSRSLAWRVGLSPSSARVSVVPCGIDLTMFRVLDRAEARKRIGLLQEGRYILFGGAFGNRVKNYALAQAAVRRVSATEILELKGYSREEVVLLLNAVDLLLLTSHSEGSPQIIKEAMACNCPIVSVDVGDVAGLIGGVAGCYVTDSTADSVSDAIESALAYARRTDGRTHVQHLDGASIARELGQIYRHVSRKWSAHSLNAVKPPARLQSH